MSKSKKTAKTGSKNNPLAREAAKDYFYGDKKVVPVKFISESRSFMAAGYDGGGMPLDHAGEPIPWAKITN